MRTGHSIRAGGDRLKLFFILLLAAVAACFSSPALAAISFVGGALPGAGSEVSAGAGRGFQATIPPDGTLTPMTVQRPTGIKVGDALIAQFIVRPQGTSITSPSGWTLLRRTTQTSGGNATPPCGLDIISYFRVIQAGDLGVGSDTWYISYPFNTSGWTPTGSCTSTTSQNTVAIGGMLAFHGIFPISPVYFSGDDAVNNGASITHFAPSINVGVNNTMIIAGIGFLNSDAFGTPSRSGGVEATAPTTGLNQWACPGTTCSAGSQEWVTNDVGLSLQMDYFNQGAAGLTGQVSATAAGTPDNGVGHMVAISETSSPVDLSITKTAIVTTSPAQVVYTITAANHGTATEPGPVTVIDTLPSALTYVSGTGTNWTCTRALQTITCKMNASLAAGASAPALTITTSYTGAGVVTNCASLSGQYGDANFNDNTACSSNSIGGAVVYSGTVYNDANRDGSLSGGETGIGQNLYVKVTTRTGGTCNSPATQVITTDSVSGNYAFNVANGNYCLILSTNNNPADITATSPASYINTEIPTGINNTFVAAGTAQSTLNFGLYQPANVNIIKSLSPAADTGKFNLTVSGGAPAGGTNPSNNVGNNGTTNYVAVTRSAAITVQETAGSGTNLASYATALSCTQGDGVTPVALTSSDLTNGVTRSGTFTAPAAGLVGTQSQVICTFTNTKLPTVTVTKVSNGGTGKFTFTGTNGWVSQDVTTVTAGVGVAGTTQRLATAGAATDIIESAPPAGFALTGINCSGLGSGGTATNDLANRKVTLNAAATAAGSAIACTFTNTAQPTIVKAFSPASIGVNDTSTMTFTLGNTNTTALTNANFIDTLTGFSVAGATIGGTCAGVTNSPLLAVGATTLNLTVPSLPTGGCTVTISVKSTAAGSYPNTTSGVTTTEIPAAGAASNTATLAVLNKLVATKQFSPSSVGVGDPSTLTITLQNMNAADITGTSFTDDYSAQGFNLQNSAPANAIAGTGCTGTLTGASGGTSFAIAGATVPANTTCTYSIPVKGTREGTYSNSTGAIATNEAGTTAAATGTLTVAPPGVTVSVSGNVYSDINHNGIRDGSETGIGQTTYIKLLTGGCSGAFSQVVTAAPGDGSFSLPAVSAGTYCLVFSTNNSSDTTTGTPANWILIEGAGGRLVTVASTPLSGQNFGLFNGSRISGKVFADTGSGGGTANNAVQDGAEAGIGGVTLKATDGGATTYDTTVTNGNGDFTLWVPTGTGQVKVVETNPTGYISTGGSAGTSGGTYDRPTDTITFTNTAGSSYSGITFADVPEGRFLTDNSQFSLPGTTVFHSHTFTAGSAGSVAFSSTAVASPSVTGWSEVFYLDSNCNGSLDSGDTQITAPIILNASDQLCILVKEFVPSNAPLNASNRVTVTAAFTYTGAPAPVLSRTYTRTDITQVGAPSGAGLTLTKAVDQATALPGNNLTYTITYANNSSGPLSNIVIHDSVPAYTSYVDACCVNPSVVCLGTAAAPFPASISACSASVSGEAITWTTSGMLAPGASGQVKFRVTVQP